ncbi:glycosyl transferase group 1 [Dokdonia sp. MED134]|uniref:glycosyltransferase family 4 protein n=1 Tax=Dokdonia sp. MED134 TaxID=313590 RepID=UPI000068B18D|nr:glycosyltransferase family 4 protein [Dokdonia sp. MED134]EAQ37816.1 glycosyl transferase group 1 [Dokdonia sp. MED134]
MKTRKLLYVGNALSASGKTLTTIETLSPLLEQEGYDVIITSQKPNKLLRLLDMIATFYKVRDTVDVVLIDTYSTLNFWFAVIVGRLCSKSNIPYIPILHGGNLPERLEKKPGICKKLFGDASCNVAPSGYLYNAFAKAGFSNLIHIPNTLEIEKYPFTERENFKPKLLWVRSFAKIYNPLMAIKVLEELLSYHPDAVLTMVGPDKDGSLEECRSYALTRKLPVTFTGKLSKEQWLAESVHHDIFINTTNFDNMPLSVVEAMALGLLVVSTSVGGMPYLISDKEDGYLSPPSDVKLFTEKVVNAISNTSDSIKITQKARDKAAAYDWESVKSKWHQVLS